MSMLSTTQQQDKVIEKYSDRWDRIWVYFLAMSTIIYR